MAYIGNNLDVFYIYQHTFSNNVLYIGKGSGNRINVYAKRNPYWTNLYNKYGEPAKDVLASGLSEQDAFELEELLIAEYKDAGCILCNLTDGGEGPSGMKHSEKTRLKISQAGLGREVTQETRNKISKANSGRIITDSAKQNMADAQHRRFKDKNQREIIGKKVSKIMNTPERKQLMVDKVYSKNINNIIYTFKHPEYGIEECTAYELRSKYDNLLYRGLNRLSNGESNSYKKWKIINMEMA